MFEDDRMILVKMFPLLSHSTLSRNNNVAGKKIKLNKNKAADFKIH
jgi:hypothetical protein